MMIVVVLIVTFFIMILTTILDIVIVVKPEICQEKVDPVFILSKNIHQNLEAKNRNDKLVLGQMNTLETGIATLTHQANPSFISLPCINKQVYMNVYMWL